MVYFEILFITLLVFSSICMTGVLLSRVIEKSSYEKTTNPRINVFFYYLFSISIIGCLIIKNIQKGGYFNIFLIFMLVIAVYFYKMYKKYIEIFYLESCIKKNVYKNAEDRIINAVKVNNPRLILIFSLSFLYILAAIFISSWSLKLMLGVVFWIAYVVANLKVAKNIYFFNSFLRAKISKDWNVFYNNIGADDVLPYNLIGIDASYNGYSVFGEKAIPNLLRMKNSEKNCDNALQINKRIFLIFLRSQKYDIAYSYLTSLSVDVLLDLKENDAIEIYKMFLSLKKHDKIKLMSDHIEKYNVKNMFFLNELTKRLEKHNYDVNKCLQDKFNPENQDVYNYIMMG